MARNALLGMAQMPTLQYRPETQVESLGKATQAVGGLQNIQIRQMEMEKAKQDAAMLQQFRQTMMQAGKNPDPSVYGQALIQTGRPELVAKGSEIMRAVQSEAALKQELGGYQNRLAQGDARGVAQSMAVSPTPGMAQRAGALVRTLPKEPGTEGLPPADVRAMQTLGFPLTREGFAQYKSAGQKPEGQQQDIALMRQLNLPITPEGFAQLQQMRRPPEKPAFTPAQLDKRRDLVGKEYKSAVAALQTTQDVLDSVTQVKESEGLSRATGFTGTMLPSFPGGEAAFAETRLKNLKGKVTALGKAAAAATGSIGQIANQEWKILADQIAAIEEIKGTGPLLEQLDLLEAQAQGTMQRITDAYGKQFGEDFERFPQFSALPEPKSVMKRAPQSRGQAGVEAPAAGGALTPAEQAELEQLRKLLGRQPQGGQ